jgi:CAAX prenyl protease-like protein
MSDTTPRSWTEPITKSRTVPYVAPFVTYAVVMEMERILRVPLSIGYPLRILSATCVIWLVSRPVLPRTTMQILGSVSLGAAVFLIWISPDVLFGYRHSWLFENPITGVALSSAPESLKTNTVFTSCRFFGCAVVVPIIEELFWRGWLMRWLIKQKFELVPLGTYAPRAFWIVAVFFASEHGPYWEVGLVAGIAYNWWMIRTKSLADCMVAHSVTNALLSIYVLVGDHWEYWY